MIWMKWDMGQPNILVTLSLSSTWTIFNLKFFKSELFSIWKVFKNINQLGEIITYFRLFVQNHRIFPNYEVILNERTL